jgi:hypothetical protein
MHTSTTLSLVRIVWGSDGKKKRGAAAKLTKAAVCGAISFGPAISLVADVYKRKIGQRQGCYTPSIFPGVCRDDAAHECCSIPRRHQHNVFGKRAGQASEWVKIPSGLPSITYHKTNNKDIESTTFAL